MATIFSVPTNNPSFVQGSQPVLQYGPVALSIVRTVEYDLEPESDYSGTDYLGISRRTVGVIAHVNPNATASLSGQGAPGLTGDRAGVTMANLEQVLMTKRLKLTYRIGGDVVFQAPQDDVFLCDAKNGPEPLSLRILEVHGAKTALIFYRIRCWTGGNTTDPSQNNIVLSNRWSVQAVGRDNWMTDLVMTGRMRLRTDMLMDNFGTPGIIDRFRQACLPLPVPDGFQRQMPDIEVLPDGTELAWRCVDKQVVLNTGSTGPTKVSGQFTSGADSNYQDFKDLLKQGVAAGKDLITGSVFGGFWNVFLFLFPNVRNTFQITVEGPPQGSRATLYDIALRIVTDRFAPQFGGGAAGFGNPLAGGLVSLYATFPLDKMAVTLRGAIAGTLAQAGAAFDPATVSVNVDDFNNGPNPLGWKYSTPGPNPNPPNANTSRGVYVAQLLESALLDNFALPANNAQAERGVNSTDLGRNFE